MAEFTRLKQIWQQSQGTSFQKGQEIIPGFSQQYWEDPEPAKA